MDSETLLGPPPWDNGRGGGRLNVHPAALCLRSPITSWLVPGMPPDRFDRMLDWQIDNWGQETGKCLENSSLAD